MNIEKTISEHAVSDILTPMLESQDRIVTEDVAPLFDKATGLDTPPASGSVTTTIEESRSVITAIIRKAWTATLTMLGGASVLSYIAAAYTYLRTRLQGNETYGIPDRRSEISASSPLAANLALLNERKMYDGLYDANGDPVLQDGESLIALICDTARANRVTKIVDSNTGWTFDQWASVFPNLTELYVKCSAVPTGNVRLITNGNLEVHLLELETSNNDGTYYAMFAVKKLYLEDYKYGIFRIGGHASYTNATTQYIYVGCKGQPTDHIRLNNYCYDGGCALAKVQLRDGARQRFTLDCPSFQVADPYVNMTAENIVDGILTPLADNTDGATITIDIGSANVGKLTAEQIAIATDKNYNLV